MTLFTVNRDLRIGSLVEVAGTAIRIELDGDVTELTRTHGGRVYAVGQFASVVKIHFGRLLLFAYVRLLRMRSEIQLEEGRIGPPVSEDARVIEADLFGEAQWNEKEGVLDFRRGVRTYPLPGQAAYLTTNKELRAVFEGAEAVRDGEANPLVPIGSYTGAEGAMCYVNIDKLFNQHCAVLGSTGAGKSGTVAAVIHSLLEHKPKASEDTQLRPRIIVIDPHGEYPAAFGKQCAVYRAYDILAGPEEESSEKLRLPYWLMTGEEFRDLVISKTEYEATSENNIVYKGLIHARLVGRGWAESARDWEGKSVTGDTSHPADPRPTKEGHRALIASYDCDTPDPFSLDEFVNHVRKEQGVRIKSGKWETMSPSDFKSHASVLDKLAVLRSDPRLTFMIAEHKQGDPDLADVIEQFVGEIQRPDEPPADVRIVDISGLPNEVAGPLTAAIARLLFQYKTWQTLQERERDPVLLVCEEAHRYVPDLGRAEYEAAQKSIRRIAKEGRKYGIGVMLVSQRPADMEKTVLSQCNTWIVMRLTNSTDQEYVSRFLPDSVAGLARMLPSLSRQEAILVGEAAAVPARISVRDLRQDQLPDSRDISFVKGWCDPPVDKSAIEAVTKRWRREA